MVSWYSFGSQSPASIKSGGGILLVLCFILIYGGCCPAPVFKTEWKTITVPVPIVSDSSQAFFKDSTFFSSASKDTLIPDTAAQISFNLPTNTFKYIFRPAPVEYRYLDTLIEPIIVRMPRKLSEYMFLGVCGFFCGLGFAIALFGVIRK